MFVLFVLNVLFYFVWVLLFDFVFVGLVGFFVGFLGLFCFCCFVCLLFLFVSLWVFLLFVLLDFFQIFSCVCVCVVFPPCPNIILSMRNSIIIKYPLLLIANCTELSR